MKTLWELPQFTLDLSGLWPDWAEKPAKDTQGGLLEKAWNQFHARTQKDVGFYEWPEQISRSECQRIDAAAERIRQQYEGAIIFGIGGSYLGAAAVVQALGNFPLHWVSNIDPPAIENARAFAKSAKRAAIVISKSGNTVETLSAFFHLLPHFEKQGIFVVTDPKQGELRRLATDQAWESFEVPSSIGGRYSVLTAVGLLPCAVAGIASHALLEGARKMREVSSGPDCAAATFAAALWHWDTHQARPIQVLMPYWSSLRLFADWYVQLFAESLGKTQIASGKPVGPTPYAALGTSDQHSILQLLREGPRDKVVGFLGVDDPHSAPIGKPNLAVEAVNYLFPHSFGTVSQRALEATQLSLQNGQVPTYRIQLHALRAQALGALFFFFETACGISAELYGVDGFNQPGVEEAKKLLKKSLSN